MKFSFFFTLMICGFLLKAQSYVPLLDNTNEWHLGYCDGDDCYKDIYYTDGDTIAYGQQYKILDGYHYISRTFLLREEVAEKKVYLNVILPNGQNTENLLYDFSLNEGDSIRMKNPIAPFPEDLGYFKVDSIRIKPRLENQTGKYFYFSNTESNPEGIGFHPVWMEGMGSLSIINAPGGTPDYFGVGQVACFWKAGNLYFHDDEMGLECDSVLKIKEEDHPPKINIFPNPVKDYLFVKVEKPVDGLEIFDSVGNKVFDGKAKSEFKINFTGFPPGIYFIKINSSGNVRTEKILKK